MNSCEEEGIKVAFRLRPLESSKNTKRVWRALSKYNSVTQTTKEGNPLPDRVVGRTFFTFDNTFGEDTTTIEVYDNVAKGIVKSVVNGLNGTIFAYGNTNSGKTYTMQGNALDDASGNNRDIGIIQHAANDIFDNINSNEDRTFLVRVSYIEIYNEEVRDLLGSGAGQFQVLAIRECPRLGVFVNSHERIVSNIEDLVDTLLAGDKNRVVAANGVNERSSRSHSIFKITIESRKMTRDQDDDDVNTMECKSKMSNEDDGAVLISTLNLVDLAGSESVKHTGATGERQKEGGKINQSLLSLSRVIFSLGQQHQPHINFRDSKLTRILQPSLSGNARMAVICCATPSEVFIEETRSSLQFASRAKLVKTRAQINEVLDDQAVIKRLKRELADARRTADEFRTQKKFSESKVKRLENALHSTNNEERNHYYKPLRCQNRDDGLIDSKSTIDIDMGKLVSKNERMKSKICKLSESKETLEREISKLENDNNRYKNNIKSMQRATDKSRKILIENEEKSSQICGLKSLVASHENKISQLQYEFQQASKNHMNSTYGFVSKSNEMKTKIMNLESFNDSQKNEIIFLESSNKATSTKLNKLSQKNNEMERHINELMLEKDKLQQQIFQLTKQNEIMNQLEHQVCRLKDDLENVKCENKKLNQIVASKNKFLLKSPVFLLRVIFKMILPVSLVYTFVKFPLFSDVRTIFN